MKSILENYVRSTRIAPGPPQVLARLRAIPIVQQGSRGATDRSQCDKLCALHAEMLRPFVGSRIEQGNDAIRLWVHGSDVWSLGTIALQARQRQVFECRLTAM